MPGRGVGWGGGVRWFFFFGGGGLLGGGGGGSLRGSLRAACRTTLCCLFFGLYVRENLTFQKFKKLILQGLKNSRNSKNYGNFTSSENYKSFRKTQNSKNSRNSERILKYSGNLFFFIIPMNMACIADIFDRTNICSLSLILHIYPYHVVI